MKVHLGKVVLIKGDRLVEAFDTVESAYNAGVGQFGRELFLVRRVLPFEPSATAPALDWTDRARICACIDDHAHTRPDGRGAK